LKGIHETATFESSESHRPAGLVPGVLISALACCGCKKETAGNNPNPAGNSAGNPGTTQSVSSGLKKVKIGYVGLTCDADLFVAFEKGFFRDEGLDAEMVKFPWVNCATRLPWGKVDATHHLVMFLLKPIEQGADIQMTGAVHRGCLRVQASVASGIKTVADLKGKRIAVPQIGTPPYVFAVRALIAAGLDPKKDVEFKPFPPGETELAIKNGLVDAVGDSEPIGTILLKKGLVRNVVDQATDAPLQG